MRFSKWVELREQAPVAPSAGAVAPGRKDDAAQTDSKIKQTIALNLTDQTKRKSALQNLAKQLAMNPNAKPEDIKKVADAMGSDENKPGQPQK